MASSLILQGGTAVAKTLQETITQTGHGFAEGDVLRWSNTLNAYTKAQANTALNAEVAGVVSEYIDANTFRITYHGYIEIAAFSARTDPVMFLSADTAGGLTGAPPSAVGTVVKPVLTKNTNSTGYLVMNYLGTQIGGSSTIAIDEIQPVGTIMPFAGNPVPNTWLECNGTTYSVSEYPELYSAIQYTTGDRMPLYGYVAKITSGAGNWTGSAAVGGYIQFKNNTTSTWITNQPSTGQNLIYEAQAEITAQVIAVSGADVWVQVLPVYTSSTKTFVYPNLAFTTGGVLWNDTGAFTTSKYRVLDSTGKIIHTNNSVSAVSLVAFNTPDMRGRFALGINTSALGEAETDTTNTSAISGIYALGSEGGEELHTLTTGEMPAHTHTTQPHTHTVTNGVALFASSPNIDGADSSSLRHKAEQVTTGTATVTVDSTGSNTPHNNMPPYLAVRYIIKAKPYTRAAIIDGIDLPYSSLLVRDLRTRTVGGSNSDLVLHTNTAGDGGLGTERMRLTTGGNVGIGTGLPSSKLDVWSSSNSIAAHVGANVAVNQWSAIGFGYKEDDGLGRYQKSALAFERTDTSDGYNDARGSVHILNRGTASGDSVSATLADAKLTVRWNGNVGIGTTSPGATLDVNGTLRVGNFGGVTNVMAKATNAAGVVGQVIPLLTWGANIGSATVQRNHAAPIPAGTWFVFMTSNTDTDSGTGENTSFTMAQTWVVPAGQWLVFAHSDVYTATASASTSGLAWKLVNNPAPYRTTTNDFPPTQITSGNGWTNISKNNGTAQLINEQNADTATGGDRTASGCVYQGGGGWFVVSQISGYAMRIA